MFQFIIRYLRRYPKFKNAVWKAFAIPRSCVWWVLDFGEVLLDRRDSLTPPRGMMNVGSNQFTRSDFNEIGKELFKYIVDIGGIKPDDKVLDVGCGVGRMAIPLTRYLSSEGRYDGFDIVKESIDWCVEAYSNGFSNFHFHHADIFNGHYNPNGKYLSHQYKFPFPNNAFSFVLLTSVFTHMLSSEVENYLAEIQRVLVPGGRCFITYFILNEESESLIQSDRSQLNFIFPIDHGKVVQPTSPEVAVAFDEMYVRELYKKSCISIIESILYGSWCGRNSKVGYQDIIVGLKTP